MMNARALLLVVVFVALGCGGPVDPPGIDGSARCTAAGDCDDGLFCNGAERCAPDDPSADGEGCAPPSSLPCDSEEDCDEEADACGMVSCDEDGDGDDSIACGGTDCDDDDPDRFAGNAEACDGDDQDCDPTTVGTRDRDGDLSVSIECCNGSTCGPDCDDNRAGTNPTSPEVCDTLDNDCDESVDEDVVLTCYVDADRDRYALAGAATTSACDCPVGTTSMPPEGTDVDCDDARADVSPGSPEICSNTRDDDCDGTIDEAGNDWYVDCDGDGYGTGTPVRQCTSPGTPAGCPGGGHVLLAGDCDDAEVATRPGTPDLCDTIDNDCSGSTVDGEGEGWFGAPCDGDDSDECIEGARSCTAGAMTCTEAAEDDLEVCGGGDEDCDGDTDEAAAADAECTSRALPHATASTCVAGTCQPTCETGWNDCTSGAGCETACAWAGCYMGGCDDVTSVGMRADTSIAGGAVTCATRESGQALCWGAGRGTRPEVIDGILASEAEGRCFLLATGQVSCPGPSGTYVTPFPTLGTATELAMSHREATLGCVLRTGGTVACFNAWNVYGQYGNGSIAPPPGGVAQVSGLTDAVEIAVGHRFACARRATGHVVCWGSNVFGTLGDGSASHTTCSYPSGPPDDMGDCSLTPVTVSGISTAAQLAAGPNRICARLTSGEVRCWGLGAGVLGPESCSWAGTSVACSRSPVTVSGLTASAIFGGSVDFYTLAVRTSGETVEIRNNATLTAVAGVTSPSDGVFVSASSCFVADGALLCRGDNASGQLGDGTTTNRPTVVPVLEPL